MPALDIREFLDNSVEPHIRGHLHTPENPNGNGIVLTHGAGSNAQAPLLVALSEAFSGAGLTVLRCELPYRQTRSFGPPGPGDAARDRAGLKNAVLKLRELSLGKVFLGGHSYGGRQSSMLCAEESDLVPGLLLLSYPLHPPRKPEQLRTQHFTDLRTPTLFVQGTRDAFATIAEIEQALKSIPGRTNLLPIEAAGHDLGFKAKSKKRDLPHKILQSFIDFVEMSS